MILTASLAAAVGLGVGFLIGIPLGVLFIARGMED